VGHPFAMMPAVTLAMSVRRTPLLRGLAPAMALSLAFFGGRAGPAASEAAAAAPPAPATPAGDFEQLIAKADDHAGQGRHAQALQAYAEAFAAMPSDLKASGVGEFVAEAAGKAAIDDFHARGERSSLEAGRAVLLSFIDVAHGAGATADPALIEAAKTRLAEVDALMPAVPEPTEATSVSEDEAEPEPVVTPGKDTAPDRSRLGLGLAVSGGVVALAGVGLVVAGLRQVPWYEGKLESEGWMSTDEGYGAQIDQAERVRNIDLGLGVAALVVGVGLGVTGAVLVARSKRGKDRGVAVVPVLGRDRAMLGASMRF
jgi:hypothetical protein